MHISRWCNAQFCISEFSQGKELIPRSISESDITNVNAVLLSILSVCIDYTNSVRTRREFKENWKLNKGSAYLQKDSYTHSLLP